jgi:hypothetical protein
VPYTPLYLSPKRGGFSLSTPHFLRIPMTTEYLERRQKEALRRLTGSPALDNMRRNFLAAVWVAMLMPWLGFALGVIAAKKGWL